MDYTTLKTAIDANINTNGNQEITGAVLNSVLNQMVDDIQEQTEGELTELESNTENKLAELDSKIIFEGPLDISAIPQRLGYVDANGKWNVEREVYSSVIRLTNIKEVVISSNANIGSIYTLLTKYPIDNETVSFAEGYTNNILIGGSDTQVIDVPDDALYLVVFLSEGRTPDKITLIGHFSTRINDVQLILGKLTITDIPKTNGYFYNLNTKANVDSWYYFTSEVDIPDDVISLEMRFEKSTGGGIGVEFRDADGAAIGTFSNTTEPRGTKIKVDIPSGTKSIIFSYMNELGSSLEGVEVFDGITFYTSKGLIERIAELESNTENKLAELESETDAKITELESETDAKITELESETDAKITELESNLGLELDVTNLPKRNGFVDANNVWNTTYGNSYVSAIIAIGKSSKVTIEANTSNYAIYTFLKEEPIDGVSVSFAEGYTGNLTVAAGQTANILVPSDAKFLVIFLSDGRTPAKIVIQGELSKLDERLSQIETSLSEKTINGSELEARNGFVDANGVWNISAGSLYQSSVVALNSVGEVTIEANAETQAIYTFVIDNPIDGASVSFAEGYTKNLTIAAGTKQRISVPSNALYLIVSLSENARPSSIMLHGKIVSRIDVLESELHGLETSLSEETINGSELEARNGFVDENANWNATYGSLYQSSVITLNSISKVTIEANAEKQAIYTFLKEEPIDGASVSFAEGYTGNLIVLKGTSKEIAVPSDAAYLVVFLSENARPNKIVLTGSRLSSIGNYKSKVGNLVWSRSLYLSESTGDENIDGKTIEELYAIYDDFVASYPQYIKRLDDIGMDASGQYQIRQYQIGCVNPWIVIGEGQMIDKQEVPNNSYDNDYYYNKILVNAGMHGDEKVPVWGLMLAVKDILESSDNWAMFIKTNVIINIIPSLNPYGFQNRTLANANGANLNRWEQSQNEPENIAWRAWIDANLDAKLYLDLHGVDFYKPFFEPQKTMSEEHFNKCFKMCNQLAAAFKDNWTAEFGASLYPRPYIVKTTFDGLSCEYTDSKGLFGFIVETPCDITGNRYHEAPNYFYNQTRGAKMTKDMFINLVQLAVDVA